jgi:hypothetical protein
MCLPQGQEQQSKTYTRIVCTNAAKNILLGFNFNDF